jgi:hypothetical protein
MEIMEITTKVCTICKVEKSYEDFFKDKAFKDGKQSRCKKCDYRRQVEWKQKNKERAREYNKKSYQLNPEKFKTYSKKWADKNKGYHKNRMKSEPLLRLVHNMRNRVSSYCKSIRANKTTRTKEMLGLNLADFKSYMESKFQEGMTWDNYGQWHVDHIKPLSLATTEQQVMELNHYTNLQPLWASENLKKSNRYEEAQHGNYGESFV